MLTSKPELIKPLVGYRISYYDYDHSLLSVTKFWLERYRNSIQQNQKAAEQAKKLVAKKFKTSPILYYEAILTLDGVPNADVLGTWDRESLQQPNRIELRLDAESILADL